MSDCFDAVTLLSPEVTLRLLMLLFLLLSLFFSVYFGSFTLVARARPSFPSPDYSLIYGGPKTLHPITLGPRSFGQHKEKFNYFLCFCAYLLSCGGSCSSPSPVLNAMPRPNTVLAVKWKEFVPTNCRIMSLLGFVWNRNGPRMGISLLFRAIRPLLKKGLTNLPSLSCPFGCL